MKSIAQFLDWLTSGMAEGQRIRDEAYLAQSADHCDLEHRQYELEHGPSRGRGWW